MDLEAVSRAPQISIGIRIPIEIRGALETASRSREGDETRPEVSHGTWPDGKEGPFPPRRAFKKEGNLIKMPKKALKKY